MFGRPPNMASAVFANAGFGCSTKPISQSSRCDAPYRRTDPAKHRAPALPAVTSQQQQSAARTYPRKRGLIHWYALPDILHRVDDRVARQNDVPCGDTFAAQMVHGCLSRCAMQVCELRNCASVRLLGKRHATVAAAKSSFDMDQRDRGICCSKSARERARRVALNDDDIGPRVADCGLQSDEQRPAQSRKAVVGLGRLDDAVRLQTEITQRHRRPLCVLAGAPDRRGNAVTAAHREKNRCELDRLRTSADNQGNLQSWCLTSRRSRPLTATALDDH